MKLLSFMLICEYFLFVLFAGSSTGLKFCEQRIHSEWEPCYLYFTFLCSFLVHIVWNIVWCLITRKSSNEPHNTNTNDDGMDRKMTLLMAFVFGFILLSMKLLDLLSSLSMGQGCNSNLVELVSIPANIIVSRCFGYLGRKNTIRIFDIIRIVIVTVIVLVLMLGVMPECIDEGMNAIQIIMTILELVMSSLDAIMPDGPNYLIKICSHSVAMVCFSGLALALPNFGPSKAWAFLSEVGMGRMEKGDLAMLFVSAILRMVSEFVGDFLKPFEEGFGGLISLTIPHLIEEGKGPLCLCYGCVVVVVMLILVCIRPFCEKKKANFVVLDYLLDRFDQCDHVGDQEGDAPVVARG